jgi:hypothetical protein
MKTLVGFFSKGRRCKAVKVRPVMIATTMKHDNNIKPVPGVNHERSFNPGSLSCCTSHAPCPEEPVAGHKVVFSDEVQKTDEARVMLSVKPAIHGA